VSRFHWMIVVPYYVFLSLTLLPLLMLLTRMVRAKVSLGTLATVAFVLAVAGVALPLLADWIDLAHLTGTPLLGLVVASFALVALDGVLARRWRLPLDDELDAL
jgi:hypothetical protein